MGLRLVVHGVRSVLNCDSLTDQQYFVLHVDFSNAFNSASCPQLFESGRGHLPSASIWFELCYRSSFLLHLETVSYILSQCCVQQGDPIGPLGLPWYCILWYRNFNTSTSGSRSSHLMLSILMIVCYAAALMIFACWVSWSFSLSQSHWTFPIHLLTFALTFPIQVMVFHSLVGLPAIGPPKYCPQYVLNKALAHSYKIPRWHSPYSVHVGLFLNCHICYELLPLCLFLMLCCTLIQKFRKGSLIYRVPQSLLGTLLSSMGNINIRSLSVHSSAAYLDSVMSCCTITPDLISYSSPPMLSPQLLVSMSNLWHMVVCFLYQCSCFSTCSVTCHQPISTPHWLCSQRRSHALAQSSSITHAGDWLSVIPSRALRLHMLDQEFRICLG